MSLLDSLDKIPDRIIPGLEAKNYLALTEPPLSYVLWRETCHATVSIALVTLSHFLGAYLHFRIAILVGMLLIFWITYQEFYLHPKKYGQKLWNGILDWLSWIIPFVIYFVIV